MFGFYGLPKTYLEVFLELQDMYRIHNVCYNTQYTMCVTIHNTQCVSCHVTENMVEVTKMFNQDLVVSILYILINILTARSWLLDGLGSFLSSCLIQNHQDL